MHRSGAATLAMEARMKLQVKGTRFFKPSP